MKNIGLAAIAAGILALVLALAGVLGQEGDFQGVMVGAIILLAAGFLLCRRGQRGRAS